MALSVPNFSEGRDPNTIGAISAAFARAELLDRHSDEVHNRTVLTLAAPRTSCSRPWSPAPRPAPSESTSPSTRARTLAWGRSTSARSSGSARAIARARVSWRSSSARRSPGSGCRCSSTASSPPTLSGASAPTFAAAGSRRSASACGRASCARTSARPRPIRRAGPSLVTARAPLAAFNVELDTLDLAVGAAIAAELRESGGGIEGVRAIAIDLGDRVQISTNVHDPACVPLGAVIERVRALAAPRGARPVAGEVVGLIPQASLRDLPDDVPLRGFDPELHLLERRLADSGTQPPT